MIFSSKFQNYINHKIIKNYYKHTNKIYPFLLENKEFLLDKDIIFFDNSTEDYFKIYMKDLYLSNGANIKPVKNLIVRNQNKINLKSLNLEKLVLLSVSNNEKHIFEKLEELNKSKNFFSKCFVIDNEYYNVENKIINGAYNLYIHKLNCI